MDVKVLDQKFGENWAMYNGDSVEVIRAMQDNSLHYSIFSPPFSDLFTYSDSERDIGNSKGDGEFQRHFEFLIGEIFRVLMTGRLVSIHCMDMLATITKDGFIGMKDFPGQIIKMFAAAGFIYHSRVCVSKDPLIQAVRTKALGLSHKQISKDSSRCNMGLPDYIITMRKPGDNPEPIAHGRGFEEYVGDLPGPKRQKHADPRKNKYSHEVWQRYASPVWFDINQSNTLNIQAARSEKDEKHICPLQLDTIARCLELWTNPDDTIFDPFAGIASTGYQGLKMGRKFIGFELKEAYYKQAIKNLDRAEHEQKQIGLFD